MAVAAFVALAAPARAQSATPGLPAEAATFWRHLEAMATGQSRLVGSDGYAAARDHIERELAGLADATGRVQFRRHDFRLLVPVTRAASLELAGGERSDLYPIWPAKARLNAVGDVGIRGELVYCGDASSAATPPRSVQGNIAVIEATAAGRWHHPFFLGASAVVILGDDDLAWTQLSEHEIRVPAHLPRFFLPNGPLADRLRAGERPEATLRASADWVLRTATNFYAVVEGTGGPASAVALLAPYDTAGLVPDLAPGAGQAAAPATALALLDRFARSPPERPVAILFTGADGINLGGTREAMLAIGAAPETNRDWQAEPRAEIAADQAVADRLAEVALDPSLLDKTGDRAVLERLLKVAETEAADVQSRLFRLRIRDPETLDAAEREEKAALLRRTVELGSIRNLLRGEPAALADDEQAHADARAFAARLNELLVGSAASPGLIQQNKDYVAALEERAELYEWLAGAVGTTPTPDARSSQGRALDLIVGLDLSDGGHSLGPIAWGGFTSSTSNGLIGRLRDWFNAANRAANEDPGHWFAQLGGGVETNTFTDPKWRLAAPLGLPAELAASQGVPAFTLATLNDARPRRDTPADTIDRLNRPRLERQFALTDEVLRRAFFDTSGFAAGGDHKRRVHRVTGQVLALAPGKPVPDLPTGGFVAVLYHGEKKNSPTPDLRWHARWTLGVRRTEIASTDAAGRYRFEGLDLLGDRQLRFRTALVYRLEPGTGRVIATSDFGRAGSDFSPTVDLDNGTVRPRKNIVFACEEFALAGLYDPRFLQSLGTVVPRDARRSAVPQKYKFVLRDGVLAGFVEPGTRNYLLFRYGQIGNRLTLLNIPPLDADAAGEGDERLAKGFSTEGLRRLGPLSMQTANDLWRLDERRLASYAAAGVSSPLLDDLHAGAAVGIERAAEALDADDGLTFERAANGAWANEALVYSAAQAMASDVIYAAIFLLLLCVPFAFCMERLVIGTPNVYRQIVGAIAIFALMTASLWAFHPAFRISNSALIIILAFAILFMSGLVIWVVYSRFETELKRVRSGKADDESGPTGGHASGGASFARASVIGQAVMLGIANMRRRRFRTFLTASTIVLITFAVLCFTSSTTYTSVVALPTGTSADHPGVMLRQRGYRALPLPLLGAVQGVGAELFADRPIVPRWWNLENGDETFALYLESVGADGVVRRVPQRAAVGLSPGEAELTPLARVLGESAAARIVEPGAEVIALSRPVADALQVRAGDSVTLAGHVLEVASVYDPDAYDAQMIALSGEPIAPLDVSNGMLDASGRAVTDAGDMGLALDGDAGSAEAAASYEHLSSSQFVLIPATLSQRLPESSLRSVSVRLDDLDQLDAAVDDLTRRFALALFAGYDDGVKLVTASQPTSVAGTAVVVPLLIGGLIIFNTMMGSIAERRREIHIYTSLGLAPVHVGALFVAEALTYGLIGAVFGYVIGQFVGTGLVSLGWLGDATLNYSGTSAMLTMGLILLVVLLSALVPARLASKIAAPSIDRTWKVPAAVDGTIRATLPFTINQTAAAGAIAYLAEWFEVHADGTVGGFAADDIEPFQRREGEHTVNGLRAKVWLSPFDLGVRQACVVSIRPGEIEDVYEVDVALTHESGGEEAWHRMNRAFLTSLRQQFLAWRSLGGRRMLEYVERSKGMFGREVGAEEVGRGQAPESEGGG